MADGFERMVDDGLAFFAELRRHNDRAWFEAHKDRYVAAVKAPAALFAGLLAEDVARLTGVPHAPKVFRIHRDVRFSRDKTPYNTHLHIMWQRPDGGPLAPAWFFGLSPDYFVLGLGIMAVQGAALTRFRAGIDRRGDDLAEAIATAGRVAGASVSDWGPAPLKRVPKPYDADHPQGDLLRRKALALSAPMPEDWRDSGLVRAATTRVEQLLPLWREFDRMR